MTVVKTALLPPRLGSGIVPRPRLIQNLPTPGRKRMSLVRAPAGYGKTTLLQQWRMSLSERGERTAWLSLDRYLSDIMTQITASLAHNVPEFQHALNERGQGKSFVTTEEQLVTCADCLTELERDVTLFMDDAHLLQPEDLRVFQRFLTRIPANTREDLGATAVVLTEDEMARVGKAGERAAAARRAVRTRVQKK